MKKQEKKRNIYKDMSPNKQIRELLNDDTKQKELLAEKLGVSIEAIRLWLAGYVRPDISKLGDIAKFFDVSTDYLLGLTEAKNRDNVDVNQKFGLSDPALLELSHRHHNGYLEVKTLDYLIGTSLFWNLVIRINNYIIEKFQDEMAENEFGKIDIEKLPDFSPMCFEVVGSNSEISALALQKTLMALSDKAFADLKDSKIFDFAKEIINYNESKNNKLSNEIQATHASTEKLSSIINNDLRRGRIPNSNEDNK